MSSRYTYNLSDENPGLQKQIGCMNGIFQIFDSRRFLGGRRRSISQGQRRLPPGQKGDDEMKPRGPSHATELQGNVQKQPRKEKQRNSTESSRNSVSSSSCSSSISSLDCSKTHQQELSSLGQANITKSNQLNVSLPSSQQPLDLQSLVKDSIYRETRCLSLKIASKEEARCKTLKYIDSPRPLHNPNIMGPSVSGPKESFPVLHKLQEAPCQINEGKNSPLRCSQKDCRRLSCDGRESRETFKSSMKLKELPRLSLDSKAGPARSFTSEVKSNSPVGVTALHQQEPAIYKGSPGVVMRLMGLDGFPDLVTAHGHRARQIRTHADVQYKPLESTTDGNKQNQSCDSSFHGNIQKETIPPHLRNANSINNPTKLPLEPAPWKHSDGSKGSQPPNPMSRESLTKAIDDSISLYGEIEKRLSQTEFKRSGKDLRALRQILDAMKNTRDILETTSEASKSTTQRSKIINPDEHSKPTSLKTLESNNYISDQAKGNALPKESKSPIVIMRPTRPIEKAMNPTALGKSTDSSPNLHKLRNGAFETDRKELAENQTAIDQTPRIKYLREPPSQPNSPTKKSTGARTMSAEQICKESEVMTRESTNIGKSSQTMNIRQKQKLRGMEKCSNPAIQSLDSNRNRRQHRGQLAESHIPCQKVRPNSSKLQPSDSGLSHTSSDTKQLCCKGDGTSPHKSNISLSSLVDEETSSTGISNKTNKTFIQQKYSTNQTATSMKDRSIVEVAIASSEQPSPVSVLDAMFYSDELPSPIKKISVAFKDGQAPNSDAVCIPEDGKHLSCSKNSSLNSATDNEDVENIQNLIQRFKKISSTQEESITNETRYRSRNAEQQFISDILLASGLQNDFGFIFTNIHPHSTGYLINPDLFLALEESTANTDHIGAKSSASKISQSEAHAKIKRRLIFDVVNEVLSSYRLVGRGRNGPQLWGALCSEVDRLQGNNSSGSLDNEDDSLRNDLTHRTMQWTACDDEIPWIVLDAERLIFKDLINEIVTG